MSHREKVEILTSQSEKGLEWEVNQALSRIQREPDYVSHVTDWWQTERLVCVITIGYNSDEAPETNEPEPINIADAIADAIYGALTPTMALLEKMKAKLDTHGHGE